MIRSKYKLKFYEGMSLREFSHLIDTILVVVKTDIRPLEAVNYYLDYKDFTLQTGFGFSTWIIWFHLSMKMGLIYLEPTEILLQYIKRLQIG